MLKTFFQKVNKQTIKKTFGLTCVLYILAIIAFTSTFNPYFYLALLLPYILSFWVLIGMFCAFLYHRKRKIYFLILALLCLYVVVCLILTFTLTCAWEACKDSLFIWILGEHVFNFGALLFLGLPTMLVYPVATFFAPRPLN